MSLNGLDDQKVSEAYQSALAEAGGWFLLKYVSRDEVDIFKRGNGGLTEARSAVASYEEKSPLYGFLLYRRRKVLIKYLPEGTSRLVQARVTVHFQAVTDRFSPHDTTFNIASAEELNDTALSAACSLHTAAPSSCSSSGSSQKKKLDEITEDAEETQGADGEGAKKKSDSAEVEGQDMPDSEMEGPHPERPSTGTTTISTRPTSPLAKISEQDSKADPGEPSTATDENTASSSTFNPRDFDYLYEPSEDRRFSSQTARPSDADLFSAYYKPKVKLGPRPRPSLDMRPSTSGNPARPIASLPAGMRIGPRKTNSSQRPKSRDSSTVPGIAVPPPPPIPHMPDISAMMPMRSNSSAASVRSLPANVHRTPPSPGITPEKQRLMKAMELRKKQLSAQKQRQAALSEMSKEEEEGDKEQGEGSTRKPEKNKNSQEASEPTSGMPAAEPSLASTVAADSQSTEAEIEAEQPAEYPRPRDERKPEEYPSDDDAEDEGEGDISKADSGIDVIVNDHGEEASTNTASSPISVHDELSRQSTRPSSISDDDDDDDEPIPKRDEHSVVEQKEQLETAAESDARASIEESVESSPTIVPEKDSPVPSETSEPLAESAQLGVVSTEMVPSAAPPELMVEAPDEPGTKPAIRVITTPIITEPPSEGPASEEPSSPSATQQESQKGSAEHTAIPLSAEASDNEYLSDDSFMDELQSATVEEAMPVSVSKSPITSIFPRRGSSNSSRTVLGRSVSNPTESDQPHSERTSPNRSVLNMARSFSGSSINTVSTLHAGADALQIARNSKVSSGISQRIKALAEKSNRDSAASLSPSAAAENGFSNLAWRKSSLGSSPSRSGSVSANTQRFSRLGTPEPLEAAQQPQRANSLVQVPASAIQTVYNLNSQQEKPESVSVTARIIRDERSKKPDLTPPTEISPLDLHQSPITIDHHRANTPPQKLSISTSQTSLNSKTEGPSSTPASPPSRESSQPALPRTSSESTWRSLGRRRGSETKSPPPQEKSPITSSSESTAEDSKSTTSDKKESRTSRLFKRMSSSISHASHASRKSIIGVISPTKESGGFDFEQKLQPLREPPPSVHVGDLNIQFPDTLLWKRRWVEVDAQGNLVLSASKANEHKGGITKKYHLTEFRTPYAPDLDRQELPNSVVFDFLNGSTLQCACETHAAQLHILQILKEAHEAWIAFTQQQ